MNKHAYPEAFVKRMERYLGNGAQPFFDSLNQSPPTSIRINLFKPITKFDNEEPTVWCSNGRYLAERPSFTFDPLFHAGCYYVQEASSMFVEQIWRLINPDNRTVRVLDMCAAPGGKSTHLLSLMNNHSLLVTNEVIPNRNRILQENITKWGKPNVAVTQNKPEDFAKLPNHFDIVLVDAPCSGEGLFRKDKNAMDEWSETNVEMCSIRQKDILQYAIECLKPGGHIIYSTCTYEPAENDDSVKWMEQQGLNALNIEHFTETFGAVSTDKGLQFYPHKVKGEGFYISVLQKQGTNTYHSISANYKLPNNPAALADIASQFLSKPEEYLLTEKKDLIIALPAQLQHDIRQISGTLHMRHAGILLGTRKGKDFIPAHDLALSTEIRADLPFAEVTETEAIAYLRCEPIKLDTTHRGWCLVKYQGYNLGWAKVMDNRVNNYYPRELRILKQS